MRRLGLNPTLLRGLALGFALGFVLALAAVHLPGVSWQDSADIIADSMRAPRKNEDIAFAFDLARRLKLTYAEILKAPARFKGDPVLWDIQIAREEGGLAYVNEDLNSPVRWTKGQVHPVCPVAGGREHRTYTILASIHEVHKNYIELQYLDCQ